MARFDVYANPDRDERRHTPFILDLQNTFMDTLDTFVAVPLRAPGLLPLRMDRIHPMLEINGHPVVMDTPMIATFPKRGLGRAVANLRPAHFAIQDALDLLLGDH